MFKEYVRQDEYIITAIIFVRKLLDTKVITFKLSDSLIVGLEGLDEDGGRIVCIMVNGKVNYALSEAFSMKRATDLSHLKDYNLKQEAPPHVYVAGYCDTDTFEWKIVKDHYTGLPGVSLIETALDASLKNAFLYRLNELGYACIVTDSDYLGNDCTPIGNVKLSAEEIRDIQKSLQNGDYIY